MDSSRVAGSTRQCSRTGTRTSSTAYTTRPQPHAPGRTRLRAQSFLRVSGFGLAGASRARPAPARLYAVPRWLLVLCGSVMLTRHDEKCTVQKRLCFCGLYTKRRILQPPQLSTLNRNGSPCPHAARSRWTAGPRPPRTRCCQSHKRRTAGRSSPCWRCGSRPSCHGR